MNKKDIADKIVEVYESMLGNRKAVYVSTPMTTGKNYFLYGSKQYDNSNCVQRSRTFSFFQRLYGNKYVINPTYLTPMQDNECWDHDDWMFMWRKVIKKFVYKIIFIDGWEYSRGCLSEMEFALENGICIFKNSDSMTDDRFLHKDIQIKILEAKQRLNGRFDYMDKLYDSILELIKRK